MVYAVPDMANCAFAIVTKDTRVLLVQIAPPFNHPYKWNFPGGVIEEGETIENGLVREVLEETGITCKVVKLRDNFSFAASGDNIFIYDAIYVCGSPQAQEGELLDVRWATIEEAQQLPLAYSIDSYLLP